MYVKGYRGNIDMKKSRELAEQEIYVFNSLCVGSKEHLIYAYAKAQENFKNGENVARNFHFEIMRILSGKRQIKDAVRLCGVDMAEKYVTVSENEFELPFQPDESAFECDEYKINYLGIKAKIPGKECEAFFENSAMVYLKK